MNKINMSPIVEMDGDEMTRVLWGEIKEKLLCPYINLNTVYFDLGLVNRDKTEDKVTVEAAEATKKYKVAVKCATITPNYQRVEEYNLKKMWKSPNGTIRAILDGTVFRTPIITDRIKPYIPTWIKPITIARHAYGDIYKGTEFEITEPGKAELVFTLKDGTEKREEIYNFDSPGIVQGVYNRIDSIKSFAKCCFEYALDKKQDLWFSTKDTISKHYDQVFKTVFQEMYDNEYSSRFSAEGIKYFYTLIDDAVARVIRSNGGFIWACKNYDGDVMSDMVSTAFGSLAMMTSVLVSPESNYEYEAAHGTITKHYYDYKKGVRTSSNPIALIFAWTGALRKNGELSNNSDLILFADSLEKACIDTVNSGTLTKDLYLLCKDDDTKQVDSWEFIDVVNKNLKNILQI